MKTRIAAIVLSLALVGTSAQSREWADASGKYKLTAELLARNETSVVLQKKDKSLVIVGIDQLSKADHEFLASADTNKLTDITSQRQIWTLRNGIKIRGSVVEYGRRTMEIQRRRGKIYVNDRLFVNLPDLYRTIVPLIVAHFEEVQVDGEEGLKEWVIKQKGALRYFEYDGVLLEVGNGDLYAVPFFLLDDRAQKILKPDWEEWLSSQDDLHAQEDLSLRLRARATAEHQYDAASRRMARLHLQLQAVEAGVTDVWEVMLLPPSNVYGIPIRVVVLGRNSSQAAAIARMRFPRHQVGAIAKVN